MLLPFIPCTSTGFLIYSRAGRGRRGGRGGAPGGGEQGVPAPGEHARGGGPEDEGRDRRHGGHGEAGRRFNSRRFRFSKIQIQYTVDI